MLFIDAKYAQILGSRLRNFKQKKDYLWNYSCPVCGDSSKNKLKARGYIYRAKTDLFVKCHNCGYGTNIGNLIKYVDPILYDEYVLERYKAGATKHNAHKDVSEIIPKETSIELLEDDILSSLKRLDKLDESHPAVQYVIKRKIPKNKWNLLYFAPKFKAYTNTVTPKFVEPIVDEHPRMIIPYFTNAGKCFAYQARAYGDEDPKYYTIKVDETQEKIYGLERINYGERIFVVEGPIDSLFLPNAVAVSGASFDIKQLEKYIDLGYSVCMFPDFIMQKDINEMILHGGMTADEITNLINTNTYTGMEAKLKFSTWRKV